MQALTGGTAHVRHLDGRSLPIPLRDPVQPGREVRLVGEGMPISKAPGSKGDLVVRLDVQFPRALTDAQKAQLRQVLPAS